jgi:hypothetical protein
MMHGQKTIKSSKLVTETFTVTFTFNFTKIHTVNTQVAEPEQVRGSIMQLIRHKESTLLRENSKIQEVRIL